MLATCCWRMLLFSATLTVLSAAPLTKEENCTDELVADIYILTDGSNSLNIIGWGRSLAFVSNFTKAFPLGPHNVQIAYGTFSTNYFHLFDLNKHYNHDELSQEVLNTTQHKGFSFTFDALRAIRENRYLNSTAHGARPNVPKVLIVITDGNSNNITRTIAEADALRKDQGVGIFVVSIGSVNPIECIGIAGTEKNVFSVKNFAGLETIKKQITTRVCQDVCHAIVEVDLAFVIDASGSINIATYRRNFEFLVKSIRSFILNATAARVALLTFGTHPRVLFPLTDNYNFIYTKLMDVPYQGSTSNTHLALHKALEVLGAHSGGRQHAKKTIVLVSDGKSTKPNETLKAAAELRSLQVLVITLGVSPHANMQELEAVATKPEYSFHDANFSVLVSFANPVVNISCTHPTPPPTDPTPPPTDPTPPPTVTPCPRANIVDIFFLVDASGSIGLSNFKHEFQFIRAIIAAYYIAGDGVKVALLTFGTHVRPKFKLSGDPEFIQKNIQNVTYQGSTTNTHLALVYPLDSGWNKPENGARNGRKVIILITDGKATDPDKTLKAADRVKRAGFTIIVVGVGANVDQKEINSIASKPEYAITVNDRLVLDHFASKTSQIACHIG